MNNYQQIHNGTTTKFKFESGVTKNMLKSLFFYKNKNGDYIEEQMIIPENVEDITIYYKKIILVNIFYKLFFVIHLVID
jgi:hypothetical protein